MSIEQELIALVEALRIPPLDPLSPPDYSLVEALRIPVLDPLSPPDWKDWYHFIVINKLTGMRSLININMMGRPEQGEIQVTLIVNLPSEQLPEPIRPHTTLATFSQVFSLQWKLGIVRQFPFQLQGDQVHLEINEGNYIVEVSDPRSQISISFQGEARATPLLVTEASPFGSGFIGWGLVPGFAVVGELLIGGNSYSLDQNCFGYHDHNFGRFRWGEDIGWEWFVVTATCPDGREITLILDQRTNKDHSARGLAYIFVYIDHKLRKIFLGNSIRIDWNWSNSIEKPLRLPGIMASLFSHRSARIPQNLQIEAADDQDDLSMQVNFDGMIELIVPDNQARQYTFIEELTGEIEVSLSLKDESYQGQGFIYAEYVH